MTYPDYNNAPTTPEAPPVNPPARPYGERYAQTPPAAPPPAPASPATPSIWTSIRLIQLDYLVFGVIEALIVIRLILKLLAANPDAAFTSFMYQLSEPFVAPFQGVFPTPASNGSVFEFSSLLAIIVYILLASLIAQVIWLVRRRTV